MKKSIALLFVLLLAFSVVVLAQDTQQNDKDPSPEKAMKKAPAAAQAKTLVGKGNKMRDRILERVRAQNQGKESVNTPEECRTLADDQETQCVQRYTTVRPCWDIPDRNERGKCLREKLGITTVDDEVKACKKKTGEERATCAQQLKDRAHSAIALRIYHLELRAQKLMQRGVPESLVINAITDLEEAIR